MHIPYAAHHELPAPFLTVQVEHPQHSRRTAQLSAKVDTGADISVLPLRIAQALDLKTTGVIRAMGFERQEQTYPVYLARLIIPSGQRGLVHVLAGGSDETILGRDVLNYLRLLFDGPALTLEILPST